MEESTVEEIFLRFSKNNPNPRIELEYVNDFTLVIAVLLSAQSTDKGVNKATKNLFKIASTPEATLELGEEKLKQYVKTIGLYNNKSKNIILLAKKLLADNVQKIPNDFNYLVSLPGIGRKSANVILSALFNAKTIGVDTHVFRVSNRIGLANAKSVIEVEKQLMKIIPEKFLNQCNHWLVLHGRYICKALKPMCSKCIIKDLCEFQEKLT